jgi:hypothetical protein
LWSLNTSEVISGIIKESYKQTRQDGDLNQPLSVQPWGDDGRKRRYWLIEGQNDTPFRIYRESNPKLVHRTWWSIAGTLDEARAIGENLAGEKSQAGRRLSTRVLSAIPRLEATEEVRVSYACFAIVSDQIANHRNENARNIASTVVLNLPSLSLAFLCTKVVLGERG